MSSDQLAEGYIGAGLRAELQMAGPKARAGFYVAGRGLVIGAHRDAAGELVMGDYLIQDRDGNHELGVVTRLYVGWRL